VGRSPYAFLGMGLELAVPVALLLWGGYKLDTWMGTLPWLSLLGAFLGFAVAFYNFFRRVRASASDDGEAS